MALQCCMVKNVLILQYEEISLDTLNYSWLEMYFYNKYLIVLHWSPTAIEHLCRSDIVIPSIPA